MHNEHKKIWNVLVFPGGNEIGLEIRQALKGCKEVRLFSAANTSANHAPFVYERHAILPGVNETGWFEALSALVQNWDIDVIYPAHAFIIDALIEREPDWPCPVILAPTNLVKITRSKKETIALLADTVAVPRQFHTTEMVEDFPVFVKPSAGYGAQGARLVGSRTELADAIADDASLLIQEYLPGEEYTIDCFSDHDRVHFAQARQRGRIRMGTSMNAVPATDDVSTQLNKMAAAIHAKLPLTGAWFFQVKAAGDGEFKLLEVEARIAGTMAMHRAQGVNFPLLSILQKMGFRVSVKPLGTAAIELDRCLRNRFRHPLEYDHVYIDLDDTLIIHDRVNTELVQFLYQCHNRGIGVTLISKSLADDKEGYLRKFRLDQLFDHVIWLPEEAHKGDYMTHEKAIFIDDSFSQRQAVGEKCGYATFDPSMVELLLDDRV